MNQLRSWLYGYDTRRSFACKDDIDGDPGTDSSKNKIMDQVMETFENKTQISNNSRIRSFILKIIPLKPGDCLECKLVGTAVMMTSGFLVLGSAVTARQRNVNLKRLNGLVYDLLCGGLFIGCETAALCRLMDWGPFDKT